MIEASIPLLDAILGEYRPMIADDYDGYRNHVYRMVNFSFAISGDVSDDERKKLIIAGCFHDIGIWTGNTFDYLPPSIEAATAYLRSNKLEHWTSEIAFMIDQHHRLRKLTGNENRLAEGFRKGDLVDFSLGLVKFDLNSELVREAKSKFPNSGFHKQLVRLAGRWILRHPLHPVPVLKW